MCKPNFMTIGGNFQTDKQTEGQNDSGSLNWYKLESSLFISQFCNFYSKQTAKACKCVIVSCRVGNLILESRIVSNSVQGQT